MILDNVNFVFEKYVKNLIGFLDATCVKSNSAENSFSEMTQEMRIHQATLSQHFEIRINLHQI